MMTRTSRNLCSRRAKMSANFVISTTSTRSRQPTPGPGSGANFELLTRRGDRLLAVAHTCVCLVPKSGALSRRSSSRILRHPPLGSDLVVRLGPWGH